VADAVVVVPCYNEAQRLPLSSFDAFLRETSGVSLLFVDDGSDDETLEVLRGLERATPERVSVLALSENAGKANAVRTGMLRAFELEPTYVGYWDADLATPLSAIPEFRSLLEARPGVEMVLGARVVLLGRNIERRALRHYLGRMAATAISLVLGLRVYDTQCGAKLFRASAQVRRLFEDPFVARWIFDVEILARLVRGQGGRGGAAASAICEHPLMCWNDVAGSKLHLLDYPRAALDLVRIYCRYLIG
jgi:glycosyltransferase involved in cell wall biosynthesis